jgi:hypothetical protein
MSLCAMYSTAQHSSTQHCSRVQCSVLQHRNGHSVLWGLNSPHRSAAVNYESPPRRGAPVPRGSRSPPSAPRGKAPSGWGRGAPRGSGTGARGPGGSSWAPLPARGPVDPRVGVHKGPGGHTGLWRGGRGRLRGAHTGPGGSGPQGGGPAGPRPPGGLAGPRATGRGARARGRGPGGRGGSLGPGGAWGSRSPPSLPPRGPPVVPTPPARAGGQRVARLAGKAGRPAGRGVGARRGEPAGCRAVLRPVHRAVLGTG